jgi:hypothetical protein
MNSSLNHVEQSGSCSAYGIPDTADPPDLQDEATKLVLAQAELLCAEWAA